MADQREKITFPAPITLTQQLDFALAALRSTANLGKFSTP